MNSKNRWAIVLCIGLAFAATSCGDDDDPITPPAGCDCLSSIEGPPDEFVYVANSESDNVTVINPRSCCVEATIPVGDNPSEMNASLDGEFVFVSNNDAGTVSVIHTEDNEVDATIPVGAGPLHTFWNPDHTELWVRNDDGASVSVIDLATLSVVATIPTGAGHGKMAMAPGTTAGQFTVYVSNINDGTITAINGNTKQVEATIPVGGGPHGMDYSSVSKRVYNASDAGIEVIDTEGAQKNTVRTTIVLTTRCNYLHASPDGMFMWGTAGDADEVVVVNCMTDEVVGTVVAGNNPDKFEFVEGGIVAVSNVRSADVTLINMNTIQRVASVGVGGLGYFNEQFGFGHRAIKSSLDGEFVYVPNGADDTFSIIHVATRTAKVLSIPTDDRPGSVMVAGPTGGSAYPR